MYPDNTLDCLANENFPKITLDNSEGIIVNPLTQTGVTHKI
jgi:hypothetical protein